MRRLSIVVPAALVAGALLMCGVQLAASDPAPAVRDATAVGRMTGRMAKTVRPDTSPIHTAPVRTYFSSGVSFATITSSPSAFGSPITVTCPGPTGTCKIEIDNDLQVGGNATKGAYVALWEVRDGGISSSPGGTYDLVSADGSYNTVSFVETYNAVIHGTHRIQPMVETTGDGMSAYNYSIIIRVYKP